MGSKFCMNASCGTTSTVEWKKGWPLRSGLLADLCHPCGSAYESSLFCEQFHKDQSGWRECYLCKRRLHCGCIASKVMTELMDYGGVGCRTCVTSHQLNLIGENPNVLSRLPMKTLADRQLVNGESGTSIDGGRNEVNLISQSQRCNPQPLLMGGDKREELRPQYGVGTLMNSEVNTTGYRLNVGEMHELPSPSQPSLNMNLAVNQFSPSFSTECVEGKKHIGAPQSNVVHGSASNILQKPSRPDISTPPETSKSAQVRRGRPPVEGRGKRHLLPRYLPKYTDKEVQQISGSLNVNVVPLFEKILSASDAGRIGRLVLPKACAEAYFPPIPASPGIPLKIQDVKGQEWIFQFRYWPNNNSRMYVLEGVTPCIQSMDLVAGDIVTFSRDPSGQLIMGYRKAANSGGMQVYGLTNGTSTGETSSPGVTETPSFINGSCPSLIPKESNGMPEDLSSPYGGSSSTKSENNGVKIGDDPRQVKEKKRTRTTRTRNKKLLLHSEESMVTWEEAQDMLRPSPSATHSIVDIEEHEFEAYDEPPVFGKRTIITSRPSGEQERWASCDDCSKWRRLPADALLSLKWTCIDNVWDVARCSCSAPEEDLKELENVLKVGKEYKKKRTGEIQGAETEQEPSGLYALASVAVLGDTIGKPEVATTTKHPRHRDGCSCIVCIQPPSGKGRHKSSCDCNVCSTVQRRFKTLQMRRNKKKQIKLDGSAAEDKEKTETEAAESSKDKAERVTNTGRIDLNSDPYSREDIEAATVEKEEGKEREIGQCSGVAQGGDALGDEAENIHGEQ